MGCGNLTFWKSKCYPFVPLGVLSTLIILVTACHDSSAIPTRNVVPRAESYDSNRLRPAHIPFKHVIIDTHDDGQLPAVKAVGDINGDDLVDVVVGSVSRNGIASLNWYEFPNWTRHTIDEGNFSTDMQIADIDGDGDSDVIVPKVSEGKRDIRWYENPSPTEDPSSMKWTHIVIGLGHAHDVEVGDVNGDEKPDVVVRGHGKKPTLLFLQDSPTSWIKVPINTRTGEGTALGDLDGDGDLDVVQNGYWLEAPSDKVHGTWVAHTIDENWPDRVGVTIADMNGDGRQDVLLAPSESGNGRLSWYAAPDDPKTRSWIENIIDNDVEYIHTFKVADMDNDGDLDVVTAEMHQSTDPDEVQVYINQGDALKWATQIVATTGSHNIRVADIGNDGDIDIIGANWGGPYHPIEMWENLSDASRVSRRLPLDNWQRHVVDSDKPWKSVFITSADVNADGLNDIVTGGWWYQNPGTPAGTWKRNTIDPSFGNMAAVYDFDRDGDVDVLGTTKGKEDPKDSSEFVWARNDGTGVFTIFNNIESGNGDFLQGVAVDYFQGETLEVILSWHNQSTIQALTVPSDPSNRPWSWRIVHDHLESTKGIDIADFDKDGDIDIFFAGQTVSTNLEWLRNDRTSWSAVSISHGGPLSHRIKLADINGDGWLNAVIGFYLDRPGYLAWYEHNTNKDGTWAEHIVANSDQIHGPMSLDVADMDHDGDPDIIVGEHISNGKLIVYENRDWEGRSWMPHTVYEGDEHHQGAQVIDIDGDSDLDIISIGWSHRRVILYENSSIVLTR